jgi:hypothetical protein
MDDRERSWSGANCYIDEYVKGGHHFKGPFRFVIDTDVTEIVLGMEVWNCTASGVLMVQYS